MTNTSFSADDPSRLFAPLVIFMRPVHEAASACAADTPVYLAGSPAAAGLTGEFFTNRESKKSNKASYDARATARLWSVSSELVGLAA
jgi:hypothetical protein